MHRLFWKTQSRTQSFSATVAGIFSIWGMAALSAQTTAPATPKVSIETAKPSAQMTKTSPQAAMNAVGRGQAYPWKTNVTTTVFWVGESPSDRNPTPNYKSSWDQEWTSNFGGFDDPEPSNRIANHATGEFRPKNFVPKLNPFYIALPYNDVEGYGRHKAEASRVIPWFNRLRPAAGQTVCKGRWLQIYNGKRVCFAQWEDCGPWNTDDWEFVFGNKPPKTTQNGGAGIDLSPAIRDYLGLTSGQKVHWRFVEASAVPPGPWKKYGQNAAQAFRSLPANATSANKQLLASNTSTTRSEPTDPAHLRNLAYLRKIRQEQSKRDKKSQQRTN